VRGREAVGNDGVDDLERSRYGSRGIAEVEVDAVAEHLDDLPSVPSCDLTHELGERQRCAGRGLVARLLGETRVAGEIGEDACLDLMRRPVVDARLLERSFSVLKVMFRHECLGVTPEQPPEHLFARMTHLHADLADRRLERFIVREPASAERFLDRGVEVVGLVLSDSPRTVAPNAKGLEHRPLAHPCAEQHRECFQDRQVLLTTRSSLRGRGSPIAM
jgi:hypothetical protein